MRSIFMHILFMLVGYYFCPVNCSCGEPDIILNASNNSTSQGTYEVGVVIKYSCNSGYRVFGYKYYTCDNGTWSYGTLKCIPIVCEDIDAPEHGSIFGSYTGRVGTVANFECDAGYDIVGSNMLCRADGKWRPSEPPTCTPKHCGEFGPIPRGTIWQTNSDGLINTFGKVIQVTCDIGYFLLGKSRVTCSETGEWDDRPSCELSTCPPHLGLNSSCIWDKSLDDDVLTILCEENSVNVSVTQVGDETAYCYNNQWDPPIIACYCDCKIGRHDLFVATNLVNDFLKHGNTLQWICQSGGVKNTEESIRCSDGVLHPVPKCLSVAEEDTTTQFSTTNERNVTHMNSTSYFSNTESSTSEHTVIDENRTQSTSFGNGDLEDNTSKSTTIGNGVLEDNTSKSTTIALTDDNVSQASDGISHRNGVDDKVTTEKGRSGALKLHPSLSLFLFLFFTNLSK